MNSQKLILASEGYIEMELKELSFKNKKKTFLMRCARLAAEKAKIRKNLPESVK